LAKRKSDSKDLLKGDKLRDLILLVHLNNKYGKGRNDTPELKEILGYSTGGIYNALNESGFFERRTDGLHLTNKGEDYLRGRILPQYDIFKTMGLTFVFLGFVFYLQWFQWTYKQTNLVFPWYSALSIIALGIFMRFFILRTKYFLVKRRKKMDY